MIEIKITIEEREGRNMTVQAVVSAPACTPYEKGALHEVIAGVNERLAAYANKFGSDVKVALSPLPQINPGQNPGGN